MKTLLAGMLALLWAYCGVLFLWMSASQVTRCTEDRACLLFFGCMALTAAFFMGMLVKVSMED